jgi:hypothetical protein
MADEENPAGGAPARVELSAPNYSLEPLDFATPTLSSPVTPLHVQDYSLGSLEFGAPGWRVGRVHVTWNLIGHPPDIPADLRAGMISALAARLSSMQAATPWKQLVHRDPAVQKFARELAEKAGIETSDYTLRRQIISPAFRIWRSDP